MEKTPKQREATEKEICARKVRYPTAKGAEAAAAYHKNAHRDQPRQRSYRCPWCPGWHLTTKNAK